MAQDFVDRVMNSKPDSIDNQFIDRIYTEIKNDPNPRPTVKSISMADVHIDPYYKEGAATSCPFALCCREIPGYEFTKKADDPGAGKYGTRRCDLP